MEWSENRRVDSIRSGSFQPRQVFTDSSGPGLPAQQDDLLEDDPTQDTYYESLGSEEDLDEEEEQAEGERHEEELLEKYPLDNDPEAEALLDELYERLSAHMGRTEVDYELLCLNSSTPFASSCPNGAIYFTNSLLALLEVEEVLFFAAHELAHTELRHYATRRRRLAELRQLIPAPVGSPTRQRLELAAVLCVRHQEEFEADFQAGQWIGRELGGHALGKLHEVCKRSSPRSLNRPTHPPFERRVSHLLDGTPFPPPLEYLYSLL